MNYLLFVIGSEVEYLSIFIFMFSLFRFEIKKDRIIRITIIAFILCQVSYIIRKFPEIVDVSSYIQIFLMIIVLWALFRVPLYYSFIMNGAGFIVPFAIQVLTVGVLYVTGTPFNTIADSPILVTATQIMSATIVLGLSRWIVLKNFGYDYVPAYHRVFVEMNKNNAILFAIVATTLIIALIAGVALRGNLEAYIVVAGTIFLLSIPFFIYFSRRKDIEDAR